MYILSLLHKSSVLFLESLADSLGVLEELLGALLETRLLSGRQSLGGEVVDTVSEASLDERRVELC